MALAPILGTLLTQGVNPKPIVVQDVNSDSNDSGSSVGQWLIILIPIILIIGLIIFLMPKKS